MSGIEDLDIAQPAMDDQPPDDCPNEETATFGVAIDALLRGAGEAAPVGDEAAQDSADNGGDENGSDENADSAGSENGGDGAHDEGEDTLPITTATGTRAAAAPVSPAASTPPSARGRTFVVTLRIALTGDDAAHPGLAPYGHVVAGSQTMGVVTADATPAIVRRVALDDAAALGAALLALPGDYATRDAARKAAAAVKAEADKQERKDQQAAQRREAAAAKKKADLLAAARKAGSALAAVPGTMSTTSPPVAQPTPTSAASDDMMPTSTSAPSDDVISISTSAPSDDVNPTSCMTQPAASPALPVSPATGKTTGKTKTTASSTLQPSLFS